MLHAVAELVLCGEPVLVVAEDSKLAGGVRTSSSETVPVPQPRNGVKVDELTDSKFSKILFVTHLYPLELGPDISYFALQAVYLFSSRPWASIPSDGVSISSVEKGV